MNSIFYLNVRCTMYETVLLEKIEYVKIYWTYESRTHDVIDSPNYVIFHDFSDSPNYVIHLLVKNRRFSQCLD